MVTISHTSKNGGVEGLLRRIKKMASHEMEVGIPASENGSGDIGNAEKLFLNTNGVRKSSMIGEMQGDIDGGVKYTVALQAYIHEHGSPLYKIPPRPVIEPAIEKYKAEIAEDMEDVIIAACENKGYMKKMQTVVNDARDFVKGYFDDKANGWAPNAQSTIDRKGSAQPLIDKGAMRQAISGVVDGSVTK